MRCCPLLLVMLPTLSSAQEAARPLILIDTAGKEVALTKWAFASGTRHLSWLAKDAPKKGAPAGPEFLEFRESKPEMYQEDVTTFIPLTALKQMEYEHKAKEVLVTFVAPDGKDITLRGPTKYKGINQYSFDGEVGAGSLSVGGAIRVQDGAVKVDFKVLKFPDAKPAETVAAGPQASVLVRGKDKRKHEVHDLMPLYRVAAGYRLFPALMFQKSLKIDLGDVAAMTHLPPKTKKDGFLDFDVEKRDGTRQGLTLLEKTQLGEKEAATLVGLIGRVPAGYRLFPATIIAEVSWAAAKK